MAIYMTYDELMASPLSETFVEGLFKLICNSEGISVPCDASLTFVLPATMAKYNQLYRSVNKPTDVISIECEKPSEYDGTSTVMLGDIIICPEIVQEEAKELDENVTITLARMVIHGFFHLLGYDHETEIDATIMERKEASILRKACSSL